MKNNKKTKLVYVLPEYNPKTPTHFAHLYDFIKELGESFNVFLVVEKVGELRLPNSEVGVPKSYVQRFGFLPLRCLENFAVLKLARFRGYKTFYVHYSFLSAFNASLITKILGGKVFYWNCGEPWKYKRGFWRGIFEKWVYGLIDFLVTGTEGLKKQYAEHYKIPLEKIKVMPNWVNISNLKSQISNLKINELKTDLNIQNQKVVLFVHRLSRRKGAHFLPEIVSRLIQLGPVGSEVVLVVIGDGPERANSKFKIFTPPFAKGGARNSKLSHKVRFLGWVPNEEIYKYYALADVFIMPSEEEGFPRVLLEAMAMEIPFVAFDVGGVKEIIPPEFLPFVVKQGDVESFSLKIKELLNLPQEELEELKSIEKNWVQKYDRPRVAELFREIISSN